MTCSGSSGRTRPDATNTEALSEEARRSANPSRLGRLLPLALLSRNAGPAILAALIVAVAVEQIRTLRSLAWVAALTLPALAVRIGGISRVFAGPISSFWSIR